MRKVSVTPAPSTTTYMNTPWVKNVYNLLIDGVLHGAKVYTGWYKYRVRHGAMWVQTTKHTQTINMFPPTKYTAFLNKLPPIKPKLYTLSTAPIIKKMK